jgi:rubrerythrin
MYLNMSSRAASGHIKQMLLRLAEEESVHEKLLRGLDVSAIMVDNRSPLRKLRLLEDIDRRRLFAQDIRDINETLDFAIIEEEKDNKQYSLMMAHINFGEARTIFEELARQEARHKMLLQKLKLEFNGNDWSVLKRR